MNYLLHLFIMISIYSVLAMSINIITGYAGLLSLAHAAFYGIGAYTTTLMMIKLGINFFPALICGIIVTGLLSLAIGYPSLKLKGDYFVLTTIGFQIIVFSILYNWISLTRGPYGIPGIPRPSLLGHEVSSLPEYFVFSLIIALVVFIFVRLLANSPFSRALRAMRDVELAASAMGKDVFRLKFCSIMVGSSLAAIAGALYATYVTYIDPTSFTLDESIFILTLLLVGGSGNLRGPIVGAIFMVLLPEALRFIGLPDTIAPNVRQIIYGLLLIILMRYRPQGLAGEYRFE